MSARDDNNNPSTGCPIHLGKTLDVFELWFPLTFLKSVKITPLLIPFHFHQDKTKCDI